MIFILAWRWSGREIWRRWRRMYPKSRHWPIGISGVDSQKDRFEHLDVLGSSILVRWGKLSRLRDMIDDGWPRRVAEGPMDHAGEGTNY